MGLVGDLSGSLAGVMILPAADPSIASYGWITGGGAQTPAAFGAFMPTQRVLCLFGIDYGCPFPAFCPRSWSKGGVRGGVGIHLLMLMRLVSPRSVRWC